MMKLNNYFRSSASFRMRIALNRKGLPYDYEAVPSFRRAQPSHCPDAQG